MGRRDFTHTWVTDPVNPYTAAREWITFVLPPVLLVLVPFVVLWAGWMPGTPGVVTMLIAAWLGAWGLWWRAVASRFRPLPARISGYLRWIAIEDIPEADQHKLHGLLWEHTCVTRLLGEAPSATIGTTMLHDRLDELEAQIVALTRAYHRHLPAPEAQVMPSPEPRVLPTMPREGR